MERCKRVESGEIILPEAIIQRIQSFMTGREAVRTSLVSKYWYSAWSTRPNLDFNEYDFDLLNRRGQIYVDRFPDFVNNTIQRYKNLTIDSVNICVNHWRHSLASSLIVKAMRMGATDFRIFLMGGPTTMMSLPKELLESETLVRLSVFSGTIDLGVNGKVSWSTLKSLSLSSMYVEGDVIWDIILGCPLIEELEVSYCKYVAGRHNMLVLGPKLFELRKLRCLSLGDMKIDTSFFCDFSFKFPCLKDLTINDCYDYKAIKISSPSLERITFIMANRKMLKANFDVPCIRKFTFSGRLPSLSLGTSSLKGKWESDISVTSLGRKGKLTPLWFRKLKEFLIDLSPSRISLTLSIRTICEGSCGDIQGLAKPIVVDNLRVLTREPSFVDSALLDGLFWSCQPKVISCTDEWQCTNELKTDIYFLKLLYKKLHIADRNTIIGCLRDLKEVNVELYDLKLNEWHPAMSTKASLYVYPFKPSSRFKLRWA